MTSFWRKLIPSKNDREVKRLRARLSQINELEPRFAALSPGQLQEVTGQLRQRFEQAYSLLPALRVPEQATPKERQKKERQRIDGLLDDLLPEAFAVVREVAKRILGMRHYDEQLLGGMVLHEGKIAEMKTGEGKTLVATLPTYLNALAHKGVHVVTVNEYLASRDAQWMGQIYRYLGMDVGLIVNGKSDGERQLAYQAPITYGTNSEFGFDYLRDNMKLFLRDYVQREPHFAIVDEVDSILIDEARTPLIISGPAEASTDKYIVINQIIPSLKREQDYSVDEKARTVLLTEQGIHRVEQRLNIDNLYTADNMEILHHVNQGLRAHTIYRRDVDYIVEGGKVKIIDEFTGRVLDGRRWSDGLHQAVEAKEGVRIENENQTLASITYQNYFRQYRKLAGMTGTAETEAEEFAKIYDLDVVAVPTHRPMVRKDMHDVIYKSEREKFESIVQEIVDLRGKGQPVLVGTVSVEKSEVLSRYLSKQQIPHQVLNAKVHHLEAAVIAQAGRLGAVTIATNMAGRGTDILLGGNSEFMAKAALAQEGQSSPLSPEQQQALYDSLLEKFKVQCTSEGEQVRAAGGLHILGTERHESRRIDNQLRGRAGRQGDPGSSRFYLSLEDDLMRIFGGDRLMSVMERLGMKDGEVIEHPWVNKTIENAQRRVEGHNFDIRKHLLEYDDVMNDQRTAIYRLRREVLGSDNASLLEMLRLRLEEPIEHIVSRCCPEKAHPEEWDWSMMAELLRLQFDMEMPAELTTCTSQAVVEEALYQACEQQLEKKLAHFGEAALLHVARILFLQTIDSLWKEHLRDMDHLRDGISLRGYAQKDPKAEYKKEGYLMFARMMGTIASDTMSKIFRVVITATTEASYNERLAKKQEEQMALQQRQQPTLAASPMASQASGGNPMSPATPGGERKRDLKVGRNDPCPCGSGKKYKKCHLLVEKQRL